MPRTTPVAVAAAVVCSTLAAGCQGDRLPLAPTPVPAAAGPPRLTATRFLAFGDSVTAGEVTAPRTVSGSPATTLIIGHLVVMPDVAYPTVLARRLQQRYTTQSIDVENAGRPGESAPRALARFAATLAATRPDVVLLLEGYNDLDSLPSITAAANAAAQMVDVAQEQGTRVYVATLTPGIPGRPRSPSAVLVDAYNTLLRAVAAGHDVPLVDLHELASADPSAWIGVDGLHPTEHGYARIAEAFFTAIRAGLEAR